MSITEVVWLVVAAFLALATVYSLYLGVAHMFAKDGRKAGLRYLGMGVLLLVLWNGWNWLMGK